MALNHFRAGHFKAEHFDQYHFGVTAVVVTARRGGGGSPGKSRIKYRIPRVEQRTAVVQNLSRSALIGELVREEEELIGLIISVIEVVDNVP